MAAGGDVDGVPDEPGTSTEGRWTHPLTGELHRLAGPAVVSEVDEAWFVNGVRHRVGGPAWTDQYCRRWYFRGALHRVDGPAVEHIVDPTPEPEREREWWVRGLRVHGFADVVELERLLEGGELELLEMVLNVWRPGGPSIVELSAAVAAARS